MLLILYFFFNVNLINEYIKLKLKISVINFVNDVNILIYKTSTEDNYKILNKLYNMYKK